MSCTTQQSENDENITVTVGEDLTVTRWAIVNDVLIDATGGSVYFAVKENWKDAATVFTRKNAAAGGADNQVLIIVPQTGLNKGRIEIYLVNAQTVLLDPDKHYVYDCWLVTTDGKRHVISSMRDFVVMPRVAVVP